MTTFRAETFQNEYLSRGASVVNAIVTVTSQGSGAEISGATGAAVVLIIDVSGSMRGRRKIVAAKRAAGAAINAIPDGVLFGVVAGRELADLVYPPRRGLMPATATSRAEAIAAVAALASGGGTAMGTWLNVARDLLAPNRDCIRHAILLTDGRNETESRPHLDATIERCKGVFQCDCRGVGSDWSVEELRAISSALLGTLDIIPDPDEMTPEFERMIERAMGKRSADVRLRLWTPRGVQVRFVKQVSPSIEDLTARATALDEHTTEYQTGAWGPEDRDYHLALEVPPRDPGERMLAGRVCLVVDGETVTESRVLATWTDDVEASARIDPSVAHYTGQAELASAIAEGLAARSAGDPSRAAARFGTAVRLAAETGHDRTLQLLSRVVEIVDPTTGTVRLRRDVVDVDEMTLDTRSTRTVRHPPRPPEPPRGG